MLECRQAKASLLPVFIFLLLGLTVGIFLSAHPESRARHAGWIVTGVSGLLMASVIYRMLSPSVLVTIGRDEITDNLMGFGKISFDDIVSMRRFETAGPQGKPPMRFLWLEVKQPETYMARLSRGKRWVMEIGKLPPICLSFDKLSPSLDEVWDYFKSTQPGKIREGVV